MASTLDLPDIAASMVLLRARMARKSGRLTHAMGSLHDLQVALRHVGSCSLLLLAPMLSTAPKSFFSSTVEQDFV